MTMDSLSKIYVQQKDISTAIPSIVAPASLFLEQILAATAGAGAQLFTTILLLLLGLASGVVKAQKVTFLWIVGMVVYGLSGFVGGLVSGMIFRHLPDHPLKKKNYLTNTIITCCLYPFPFLLSVLWITMMSLKKGLVNTLPNQTFMVSSICYANHMHTICYANNIPL
jgi:hypothetical protein